MTSVSPAGLSARSAREALGAIATDVEDLGLGAVSRDPLAWPGYCDQLERAQEGTGETESVIAAGARIGETAVVVVALDFGFLGGSIGEGAGDRIVGAFEEARRRRVPVVSLIATGGARMQEGMRSLIQMQRIAAGCAAARADGIPHIGVLRHPTTGGIWASLAASADVLFALPEALVAFAGPRVRAVGRAAVDGEPFTAEGKHRHGFVDAVLAEHDLREAVALAVELLAPASRGDDRPAGVPRALGLTDPSAAMSGWASVETARAPGRPRADARALDRSGRVLRGDRAGGRRRDPGARRRSRPADR